MVEYLDLTKTAVPVPPQLYLRIPNPFILGLNLLFPSLHGFKAAKTINNMLYEPNCLKNKKKSLIKRILYHNLVPENSL